MKRQWLKKALGFRRQWCIAVIVLSAHLRNSFCGSCTFSGSKVCIPVFVIFWTKASEYGCSLLFDVKKAVEIKRLSPFWCMNQSSAATESEYWQEISKNQK
jgi:hypothetical protein